MEHRSGNVVGGCSVTEEAGGEFEGGWIYLELTTLIFSRQSFLRRSDSLNRNNRIGNHIRASVCVFIFVHV